MEVEKLKCLRDQIRDLEKDEHFEVLRIIRKMKIINLLKIIMVFL